MTLTGAGKAFAQAFNDMNPGLVKTTSGPLHLECPRVRNADGLALESMGPGEAAF
jgi:hypothetical protein